MTRLLKLYLIISCLGLFACKKYLDAKPDKSLQTPTTVDALQGILDNYYYMNELCEQESEIASDNYYLTDSLFNALPADRMRSAYIWGDHIFAGMHPDDWQNEYTVVYNANVVLDNLPSVQRNTTNADAWDNCKGEALVFRAKSFFEIAQVWAKAYDSSTAGTDLGIPLRLTSDYNTPTTRSNIKATYEQIIADLKEAIPLLPDNPLFVFRPSKPAAYGILARTFLITGDYKDADLYADSCLRLRNALQDFNSLDADAAYPFSSLQYTNPEDIMHTICYGGINYDVWSNYGKIDTTLFNSYADNDLRKVIYFKANADGSHYFVGNYDATPSYFAYNGIAVDEMYLTRAECEARMGNIADATNDLNTVLIKRWKAGTFQPVLINNPTELLNTILTERRKELVYRSLRFSDIKRLNRDGANIILKRIVNGATYTLSPNDKRYALPIPDDIIQMTGIAQN